MTREEEHEKLKEEIIDLLKHTGKTLDLNYIVGMLDHKGVDIDKDRGYYAIKDLLAEDKLGTKAKIGGLGNASITYYYKTSLKLIS